MNSANNVDGNVAIESLGDGFVEVRKEEKTDFKPVNFPGQWTNVTSEIRRESEVSVEKPPTQSVDRWIARGFQDAMKGSQGKPPWVIEDLLLADSATLVSAQETARNPSTTLRILAKPRGCLTPSTTL